MTKEAKLMQLKAGLITEDEYMNSMEELNLSKNNTPNVVKALPKTAQELAAYMRDAGMQLKLMKGLDSAEVQNIASLIDALIAKAQKGSVGQSVKASRKAFDTATRNVG